MELKDIDLVLNDIPLFAALSGDDRALVRERSKLLEYKKGTVIYREGSPADAFFCVAMGRVVTSLPAQRGRSRCWSICIAENISALSLCSPAMRIR